MSDDLETRIAAALGAEMPSAEIAALIAETKVAIVQAEIAAGMALDLIASPRAPSARAVSPAEFALDRWRAAVPRLEANYKRVAATEYLERWRADYDQLKVKRDALATEFAELYPEVERKLPELLIRMAANDAEISRLHQASPSGQGLRLLGAELVARGLERFTREKPSIARELRLPKFAADERLAWPSGRADAPKSARSSADAHPE